MKEKNMNCVVKQFNQLKVGEKFTFVDKGLNYGVDTILFGLRYAKCNNKQFILVSESQFTKVDSTEVINCFICGRGENKKLYYSLVKVI